MSERPHEERDAIVEALRALPAVEPRDHVVRSTLAAVERDRSRRRWALGLFLVTAAVALLAFVGIVLVRPDAQSDATMADSSLSQAPSRPAGPEQAPSGNVGPASRVADELATVEEPANLVPSKRPASDEGESAAAQTDLANEIRGDQGGLGGDLHYWRSTVTEKEVSDNGVAHSGFADGWLAAGQQGQARLDGVAADDGDGRFQQPIVAGSTTVVLGKEGYFADGKRIDDTAGATFETTIKGDVTERGGKQGGEKGKDQTGFDTVAEGREDFGKATGKKDANGDGSFAVELAGGEPVAGLVIADAEADGQSRQALASGLDANRRGDLDQEKLRLATVTQPTTPAELALQRRVTRDSSIVSDDDVTRGPVAAAVPLVELEPRGYWADTYVPGDPELAWLRTSLASLPMAGERVALEERARPVDQPFDAPQSVALGLTLASDTPVIDGPTRMTLQVGIAGAKQAPTRRAALSVALVIDVAAVAGREDDRRLLWSIADALVNERQAGDSFAVVVPRADGPAVLQGDALTASEVARFLGEALSRPSDDVAAALNLAYQVVHASSTAASEQTIGAQGVVLVTPRTLDAQAIAARAHAEALRDVRLSVVGVGKRTDSGALGDIARAGQGRRWLASDASSARRALQDELTAAGKAVARAVRLRIRLADGVKFYGILGSQRLDEVARLRTKAAEEAIDRKLAETMGVSADRGEDEDGIQIVIPAFMSGDEHVILLDVEVQRPGPVLDVRARWKDLVRVGNGEAQASLAIGQLSGQAALPPSAKNVRENRVALLVGNALVAAGRALEGGQVARAQALLETARRMVMPDAGLPETNDELALLASYIELVARDPMNTVTARSLAVAGRTLK